jgi:hypothetical protein
MAIDLAYYDYIQLLRSEGGAVMDTLTDEMLYSALVDTESRAYAWTWRYGVRTPDYELTRRDETTFTARHRFWVPSPKLVDRANTPLTPTSADVRAGVWSFTPAPSSVLISGTRVNLLDAAISAMRQAFNCNIGLIDSNDPSGSIQLSQQVAHIRQALSHYLDERGAYER